MKSDRFLIKVAELYYRDGLSQQEIAQKLHTSRTSISRALIQARNEGCVQIRIQYPEQSNLGLERELEEKYGLTEALVAVPAYDQSSDQEVAFQAVDYTLRVLKKNMVLGMTWGRAMHGFVEQLAQDERLRSLSFRNVKIVPFLGTPGITQIDSWDATTYSNTLATKVGNLLHCASYNLSAPMYVDGEKEKELIEGIDEISKVLRMAETADMALIGIGSMQKDSSIIKAGIRTEEEYKELIQKGAVGEIVGRIYDKNGQTVDEDLQRKMIGISLDKIAKIPVRVGISYGKDKIEAIKGAIAGGLVNVLVTDVPTAELLLK
nr:sugar-binding transcriptional regulator [uncultured Anaerostipes sp.]